MMTPLRRSSRARGETLIEAMISLAILSVGLLGILQMNGLASQQSGVARRETVAATIARDLVDAFERLPYNHPALAVSGTPLNATFIDPKNTDGLHKLTNTYSGRPLLGSADASLKTASVQGSIEVMWRTRQDGASKRIAIMILYPSANGIRKQMTVWTTKADFTQVLGGGRGGIPEI